MPVIVISIYFSIKRQIIYCCIVRYKRVCWTLVPGDHTKRGVIYMSHNLVKNQNNRAAFESVVNESPFFWVTR